jgi:F-type H+-transporting ATPase subunit a
MYYQERRAKVEGFPTLFQFNLFGINFPITLAIVEQWVIMLAIVIFVLSATRRLQVIPKGIQIWGEIIVELINNVVKSIMGEEFIGFAPYIGTIMIYILIMNTLGLSGFEPPTSDYSIALSLALCSFVLIQATAIRHNGLFGYIKGYGKPIFVLAPLNIIERLVVPVSLSLRLFGNIYAASVLMSLIHGALESASKMIHLGVAVNGIHFGLFQLVIPLFASAYFDIFDGAIQMVIFSMLTMIFIKITAEH